MIIVVDLAEKDIQALAAAYPLPRYCADPHQMRQATLRGSTFNIIDSSRGEKADLFPLSMDTRYAIAFTHRVRQIVDTVGGGAFEVWAARPEEVVIGKLLAWDEGRSERHPSDIYEMIIYHLLGGSSELTFDFAYIDERAADISSDVAALWGLLQTAARDEVACQRPDTYARAFLPQSNS